jgi:hypothetical protein
VEQLQLSNFYTKSDIDAENFRKERLPKLNARGISAVMSLGRLLLLVQYCLGVCSLFTRCLTNR